MTAKNETIMQMQRAVFFLSAAVLGIYSFSITSAHAFKITNPAEAIVRISNKTLHIPIESFLIAINVSGETLDNDNDWRGEFETLATNPPPSLLRITYMLDNVVGCKSQTLCDERRGRGAALLKYFSIFKNPRNDLRQALTSGAKAGDRIFQTGFGSDGVSICRSVADPDFDFDYICDAAGDVEDLRYSIRYFATEANVDQSEELIVWARNFSEALLK